MTDRCPWTLDNGEHPARCEQETGHDGGDGQPHRRHKGDGARWWERAMGSRKL